MEDKILCNVSDLEPIADAVREKENTNKLYSVEELKVKVPELISSSGIELPVLTNPATASDALSGKEFIDGDGNKVTGTIATQAAKTITPSTSSQTAVASGVYTTGTVTVAAIPSKYQDITTPLAELNTANGGTAATTIAAAVDNTEAHASSQEALIAQIVEALEGKVGGSLSGGGGLEYEDVPAYTYTVDTVSGANYGFAQNSAGYWESKNKGVESSYALCRVNFNVQETCNITFDVINYAESSYDYGLMGVVDEPLAKSASADSSVYKSFKGLQSASVVQVTYINIPAGSHFIDVKFIKDNTTNSNNDSIQFKLQAAPVVRVFSEETIRILQEADSDFVADNIKSGVSIFGVTGSYEGSGGSSGGIETCTVYIFGESSNYRPYYVSATVVDDTGAVSTYVVNENSATTITINNVVCGSAVTVYFYNYKGNLYDDVTNAEKLAINLDKYFHAYKITASAGETAVIYNKYSTPVGGGSN